MHSSRLLYALCAVGLMMTLFGCGGDPYRKVPNEQLLKRAGTELNTFNFQRASEMYRSLLNRLPADDAHRPEVMFGLALSLQNVSPATPAAITESQQMFQQLIAEAPDSQYTPIATLQIGRIAEVPDYMGDEVKLDTARAQYQKVIDQWPDQPIADEAALRLAGTYIQIYDQPDSIKQGVEYLQDWLAKRPDNEMASVMWQYLAETYDKYLNQPGDALNAYMNADRIGLVNQAIAGRTWWHIAKLAEQMNRLDVAVAYHQKIITEQPKSGRAWESQQALKRIGKAHPEMHVTVPQLRLFGSEGNYEDESEVAP